MGASWRLGRQRRLVGTDGSGDDFAGHIFDMAFSPDGAGFLFAGTGKGDLLIGSWGFGAFINEDPLAGAGFAPLTLREGQVSMILPQPDGTVLIGTKRVRRHSA